MDETTVAVLLARDAPAPDGLDAVAELADVTVANDAATLSRALARAEVLFAWDFRSRLLTEVWPSAPSVRWIHAGSVGVDALLSDQVVTSDVVVTNTRGVFERPIAEYVLALILMFVKDLHGTLALQRDRRWVHRQTEMLRGRRVVVLGAGGVARELAPLLRATGMEVDVVGRTARSDDPALGRVFATADVEGVLSGADFVVVALPLTGETHGYLDAGRIGLLPPGARIVNVGRGALVDEAALLAALRVGAVAGAALDVFTEEPLPPAHPFWTMDQVIVSPHMSGDRVGWERAVVDGFVRNLRRWQAGEDLLDVVDKRQMRRLASLVSENATGP